MVVYSLYACSIPRNPTWLVRRVTYCGSVPDVCDEQDTMRFLEGIGSEPPRSPKNHRKRILRKLWLRMTEQDYRTKLKALQILHHMSMDLTPEANVRYDGHDPTYARSLKWGINSLVSAEAVSSLFGVRQVSIRASVLPPVNLVGRLLVSTQGTEPVLEDEGRD